jgi:hypothetical protein
MTWRLIRKRVLILPRRQPDSLLPGLVIHLVSVDVLTARAAAEDRPCTSLNLYVSGVALVSYEERSYGSFLFTFSYPMVVVHDYSHLQYALPWSKPQDG